MAESVRAKAEEFRTRIRTRVEAIRGGSSGGSSPGVLSVLEERFPKIKEIREKGILAPTPAAEKPPEIVDLVLKPELH